MNVYVYTYTFILIHNHTSSYSELTRENILLKKKVCVSVRGGEVVDASVSVCLCREIVVFVR